MKLRLNRSFALAGTAFALGLGLFFGLREVAHAQGMKRPSGPGKLHFETELGSFKLLSIDNEPVTGRLEMTFKGGLLISGIDKEPHPVGKIRKEYEYAPLKKYAYSGEGKLVVEGPFRSLQWFGSHMKAYFEGRGKVRLVGEFDKNLNTGTYWTTDPKKARAWSANNVAEVTVPDYMPTSVSDGAAGKVPTMRKPGGN